MSEPAPLSESDLLLDHLEEADLLQMPAPQAGEPRPPFLPPWYDGPIPVLVYPPLSERGVQEGDSVSLELGPPNIYFGATREMALTEDPRRAAELSRLVLELHPVSRYLFAGSLEQVVLPPGDLPGVDDALAGSMPVLIWPSLDEQRSHPDEQVDVQLDQGNVFYGLLRELAESADEARAEQLRTAILAWHPEPARLLCWLGRQTVGEDLESAMAYYELAVELDGSHYEALQDGGSCAMALAALEGQDIEERLAQAEELLRAARVVRPDSGLSAWSLGRVLYLQGAEEEAEEELAHFLRHYPEGEDRALVEATLADGFLAEEEVSPEAQADMQAFQEAAALALGEDPARAVELLEPISQRHPNEAQVWFLLGAAYRRLPNVEEAERCLRRASRLAGGEPFVWWELGKTLMTAQEWRSAEGALRKALELDADNPAYLADLARTLHAQGDREGAREAVAAAVALVPDDPEMAELAASLGG